MAAAVVKSEQAGIIYGIAAMLAWSLSLLYWKMLLPVGPLVIILYRVVTMAFVMFVVCLFRGEFAKMKKNLTPKLVGSLFISGLLITGTWLITIVGAAGAEVVQVSLGYFIEPLMVAAAGIVVFHEKLTVHKLIAFVLVFVGAGVMVFAYGGLPKLAFLLAVIYTAYAIIKKKQKTAETTAVFLESALLVPIVLPVLLFYEYRGDGLFALGDTKLIALMCFAGIVTATPIMLFSLAARRIEMVALGFISYIDPTVVLIIGLTAFGEKLTNAKLAGLLVIVAALFVFSLGSLRKKQACIGTGPA